MWRKTGTVQRQLAGPQPGWVAAAGRAVKRERRYLPYPLIAATAAGFLSQDVVLGVVLGVGWWVQAVALATRHEHVAFSLPDR